MDQQDKTSWVVLAIIVAVMVLRSPGCKVDRPEPATLVTAVTYTYDDKQHSVPPPVAAALDKLNRQGITATLDEVDTLDASGAVPEQYKASRPAAVAAGLPALVVMAGEKVRRVVPKPTTAEQVEEAAK